MAQIKLSAERAQMEMGAEPDCGFGHYDRGLAGTSCWPAAHLMSSASIWAAW
jgi:hypothetical protein